MDQQNQKEIAICKISESISELNNEHHFVQAAILEGRIKGFLELSFAIGLISQEENAGFWKAFAEVREKLPARFPEHSALA
jgi:hypothetical protein